MEQRHEAVIAEKLTDLTLSPWAGKFERLEEDARKKLLTALNVRFERVRTRRRFSGKGWYPYGLTDPS